MRKRNPKGKIKTTCSKCSKPLQSNRIGKNRYCLECHNEYMKETRPKHSQLTDDQRLKANARSYLHVYIKRGKIVKQPCKICGDINVQAHHNDHNKPLEVEWYCVKHHIDLHKKSIN